MTNNANKKSLLVFSDLDGSLLDHFNYSWDSAIPALNKLQQRQIPLIFNTSKTLQEVVNLRGAMANQHPFICENGAAIYIPKNYFSKQPAKSTVYTHAGQDFWYCQIGEARHYWQQLLHQAAPDRAIYRSFAQLGNTKIAQATGLSIQEAANANQRSASEVIQWLGNNQEKQAFIVLLQNHGAQVLEGGRFLHLLSPKASKGSAMRWLANQYLQLASSTPLTVAIGDSSNDLSMLESSDYAIVIRRSDNTCLKPQRKNTTEVYFSDAIGPLGWNNSLLQLLDDLPATLNISL